MSGFVDECRREWKRLRVPDALANEMAAELESDLAEAEADGASPEEVLGKGVFDARAFAAAWAAERGVVPPAQEPRRRFPTVLIAALAVSVAITIAGVVVLTVRPTASVRLAVGAPTAMVHFGRLRPGFFVRPPGTGGGVIVPPGLRAKGVRPLIAAPLAPPSLKGIGWTLLGIGLIGTVLTLVFWWWLGRNGSRPSGDDLAPA